MVVIPGMSTSEKWNLNGAEVLTFFIRIKEIFHGSEFIINIVVFCLVLLWVSILMRVKDRRSEVSIQDE